MAKSRTVRLEELGEDVDDATVRAAQEAADFDEANEDEGGELFRVTDEIRGTTGVKLMIVRVYPNTPDMAGHVGDLTPGEYSNERIRELYGPGRYRVRLVGPKGFLKGGGAVHIAKTISDAAPGGGGSGLGDVAAVMRAMQEKDESRRREDSERRGELIKLTVPAAITGLTTVLAALLGRQNSGPDIATLITALKPAPAPSITDLVTSLSSLKLLTESPKSETGTSQLESVLTILEKFKDFAGDGKTGESTWVDLVRDVVKEGMPMVTPLLENIKAGQQRAPTQPLIMPPTVPAAARASSPLTMTATPVVTANEMPNDFSVSGENDMLALFMPMIKEQLAKILSWAAVERDVSLYAEVLLAELPAMVSRSIPPEKALEYLKFPQWFEIVTAQEPRLIPYREWCDELRQELIDIIETQIRDDAKKNKTKEVVPPEQIVDPLNGESVGE